VGEVGGQPAINGHGGSSGGVVSVRGEVEAARVGGDALNAPLGGEGKGRGRLVRSRGLAARRGHGEDGGGTRLKEDLTGGSHLSADGREKREWAG
jgi:hypothetical protein